MKRTIYIILLLLYTTLVHAYMYQSNMPTYQPQTRIGYTTNYANGQFTPSAYQNLNTSTYSGTYNPYSNWNTNNGGSGRHGQPRRVKGYDNNGKKIGDDSPETGYSWLHGNWNFWEEEDDYYYYWDETSKTWWRKKKDTTNWEKWNEHTGHFIIDWWNYWDWDNDGKSSPTNPYVQGYHENPVPIGEPTTPLLLLMFAYLSYHEIKKRRHCKHFFL